MGLKRIVFLRSSAGLKNDVFDFIVHTSQCVNKNLLQRKGQQRILLLLQVLPGLSTGILYTYLTAEATSLIPAGRKSTAMGCYQAIYALGMTLFPAFCGQIAEAHSMRGAYDFLALLCVASAVTALLYYKRAKSA